MTTTTNYVTDVEEISATATLYPTAIVDSTEITAENAGTLLNLKGTRDNAQSDQAQQPTTEQLIAYMQHMRKLHNAKCRKKGFKDHIHQRAGHKLERKLERQGSLYGRVSLVSQMYNDIQVRKFKEAKEVVAAKHEAAMAELGTMHSTNTTNPIDFPKVENAAL